MQDPPARAYRVEHETLYEYAAPVATSQHAACLRPRELPGRQHVRWYRLRVDPEAADAATRIDYFGNTVEQFSILRSHTQLVVHSSSLVEVTPHGAALAGPSPAWESVRDDFVYRKGAPGREEAEFVFPSPMVAVPEASRDYALSSFAPGRPLLEAAEDLMHRMHRDFSFDPAATEVATPVERVLAERRGVCQDLAHVMISCLRSLGLPARYVSGYILTNPPAGEPRMLGADASHAWVSVHCADRGWQDFDPTNDVCPDYRHVLVGWGRDYGDVCPLRGAFMGGAEHTLDIAVSVIPLDEAGVQSAMAGHVAEPGLGF